MTREEMAACAKHGVDILEGELHLPAGARLVVIVTDDEGAFVGVHSTHSIEDAQRMAYCAALGADRVDHVRRILDGGGQ